MIEIRTKYFIKAKYKWSRCPIEIIIGNYDSKKMVNEAVDKLQREVPDWEFMVKDKLEEINKEKK